MLFVVGAKAAVVRASPAHGRVVALRHLGRFEEELTAATVVVDIVSDEHALKPMLGTALEHIDVIVFKHDLGVDALKASTTKRNRSVIEKIRTCRRAHRSAYPFLVTIRQKICIKSARTESAMPAAPIAMPPISIIPVIVSTEPKFRMSGI